MKTLFITIYDGLIAKNILRSDAYALLASRPEVRIVLFVHANKVEYFTRRYASERTLIEAAPAPTWPLLEAVLFWITTCSSPTHSARSRIDSFDMRTPLKYIVGHGLSFLGHFTWWRRFLRWMYQYAPDRSYDEYFHRYSPDTVFVANLLSSDDTRLMKAAKRRGVRCVGMVKSWDNVGNKPFVYLACNPLIVPNEIVRDEAVSILQVPPEQLHVVGLSQFDRYVRADSLQSRDEFCREHGLDPDKRIIVFAATGEEWTPHEKDIVQYLSGALMRGVVAQPAQILLRLHPKYRNPEDFYESLPGVHCERPGTFATGSLGEWEFEEGDLIILMNTLYHADVCINTASTMALESIVFDKPTIAIAYDGSASEPYHASVRRFYDFPHTKKLVEMGGEDVVYSNEELLDSINHALRNPRWRSEGRALSREKECFRLDGRAGERIARVLFEALELR